MSDAAPSKDAAPAAPKKPLPIGMILGVLNTVGLMSLLGILVYTKIIYKRPKMTEAVEREKVVQEYTKKPEEMKKLLIAFEPITANLKPTPIGVQVPGGPPQQMKAHTLSMTLSLEILDSELEGVVKDRHPQFIDMLLRELGTTSVDELSSVQGRFLLRSKIAGMMNDLVRAQKKLPQNSPPIVSNVYFSDFIVQ